MLDSEYEEQHVSPMFDNYLYRFSKSYIMYITYPNERTHLNMHM